MHFKRALPLLGIIFILIGCTRAAGGSFDTVESQNSEPITISQEAPDNDGAPTVEIIDPNATNVPANSVDASSTPRTISPTNADTDDADEAAPTNTQLTIPTATVAVASQTPQVIPTATEPTFITPDAIEENPQPTTTPTEVIEQDPLEATPTTFGAEPVALGSCDYEVQDGDNLFRIAFNNEVNLDAMLSANGLTEASVIQPGQILTLPNCTDNGSSTTIDTDEDDEPPAAPTAIVLADCEIEIQAGDTLFAIATDNGVSLAALLGENGLDENAIIQPGQIISIPNCDDGDTDSQASESAAIAPEATEEAPTEQIHTVVEGETLQIIASLYDGVSVNDIVGANTIPNVNQLTVGQQLIIPTPEPETEEDGS